MSGNLLNAFQPIALAAALELDGVRDSECAGKKKRRPGRKPQPTQEAATLMVASQRGRWQVSIKINGYRPAAESSEGMPDYLQERLESLPAAEGGRHEDVLWLSGQLTSQNVPRQEQFDTIKGRYPDKPDSEIWRAIDGAPKLNLQPASTSKRNGHALNYSRGSNSVSPAIKRLERKPASEAVTVPREACTITQFLERVFKPGETICIALEAFKPEGSPKWIPKNSGGFATLETIKKLLEDKPDLKPLYNEKAGVWVRINPIIKGDDSGEDKSVASFRHVMVEFDTLPKPDQWAVFQRSNLPISAVIDSGGKSLHAWVRGDANNLEQFRERQKAVYEYLADYIDDSGNKNPSRFSRLPGVLRRDVPEGSSGEQHIVSFQIGAKSWEEWEETREVDDGIPQWEEWSEYKEREIPKPEVLIEGIMHEGENLMLGGGSKTYKSWTLLEMAHALTTGGNFVGQKCEQVPVYYIDSEMNDYFLRDRMQRIEYEKGRAIPTGLPSSNPAARLRDRYPAINRAITTGLSREVKQGRSHRYRPDLHAKG